MANRGGGRHTRRVCVEHTQWTHHLWLESVHHTHTRNIAEREREIERERERERGKESERARETKRERERERERERQSLREKDKRLDNLAW